MSLEMQKAYEADGGVVNQDGSIDYVDSVDAAPQPEPVPVTAEVVQEAPQPDPMPDEPPAVDDDEFADLMG